MAQCKLDGFRTTWDEAATISREDWYTLARIAGVKCGLIPAPTPFGRDVIAKAVDVTLKRSMKRGAA